MFGEARQELIHFIELKAFNPIVMANPEKSGKCELDIFTRVQNKTRYSRDRYRRYDCAGEVELNFQHGLHSSIAQQVQAASKKLVLPTLPQVKNGLQDLVRKLELQRLIECRLGIRLEEGASPPSSSGSPLPSSERSTHVEP